ncbi:ABC transporter ATP-binding protein [Spirillospora sp. CA-255316]
MSVLDVRGLSVEFRTGRAADLVLDEVSFAVPEGHTVALVGESGSGKSVTCLALMGLLPEGAARVTGGTAAFEGTDLLALGRRERSRISGDRVSMVFQEPMTSLNPAFTVGEQIGEVLRHHRGLSRRAARARAIELLDLVGIPNAGRRARDYPHAFSGGMRQRVMIAAALACEPALVIADEPTTALDVTVQAQILELLRSMRREFGMSVLFVTHDLGVVADIADQVVVMYAGQVVETAPVDDLFDRPRHPYTEGLLASLPQLGAVDGRLPSIPGQVPAPGSVPSGCRFRGRCPYAVEACAAPVPVRSAGDRTFRCVRDLELEGVTAP